MRDPEFKEALKYLKKTGFNCANGPNNDEIIKFIKKIYKLGATKVEAALYEDGDELRFDEEIYIHLTNLVSLDVIIAIHEVRPDELSEDMPGVLRLWWD